MNEQLPDPDREEIRDRYEADHAPDGWENWGDANPEAHGGIWVSYDPDNGSWAVYETVHRGTYEELDDPEDWGQQYVTQAEVHWSDVVTEDGEFTEGRFGGFKSHAETFDRAPDTPMGCVVDGDLTKMVAWFGIEIADPAYGGDGGRRGSGLFDRETYEDVLDACGIDPDDE
jgi:hypothetical protein